MDATLPLTGGAASAAQGPQANDSYTAYDSAGVYQTYVHPSGDGLVETHLMVDGIHCASCVQTIEQGLQQAGAVAAELNYGNHRLTLRWNDAQVHLSGLLRALHRLGYQGLPYDPGTQEVAHRKQVRRVVARLGVAGFCAMNVMLYSVGLYAGYFYGIEAEFHRLFQWISALLALPAVFYSGWPFLKGAAGGPADPNFMLFRIGHGEAYHWTAADMLKERQVRHESF